MYADSIEDLHELVLVEEGHGDITVKDYEIEAILRSGLRGGGAH